MKYVYAPKDTENLYTHGLEIGQTLVEIEMPPNLALLVSLLPTPSKLYQNEQGVKQLVNDEDVRPYNEKVSLGKRLKTLRGKRTQEDVSKWLGVQRASYSHYECDHVEPSLTTLVKIADLYQVSTDYLLGRESGE